MGHPEAADKRFRVLISQATRALFGTMWYKRKQGLRWVRALEYQKRDVIHYHALMAGVQDLRRLTWMDRWHELAGYARIEPIDAADAVVRYVSKYVVKGGAIDRGGPLVPAVFPLFPEVASRPGDHEAGSEAGSVKAGAATPEGLGLDGTCRATTLCPAWLGRKADMT
jgi:hypothetical protein